MKNKICASHDQHIPSRDFPVPRMRTSLALPHNLSNNAIITTKTYSGTIRTGRMTLQCIPTALYCYTIAKESV
jgi:hypothetical protein